jgi:hypothetical protein
MDRFLRRVVTLAVAGVACASLASANVPVPNLSTVRDCVGLSPNGALVYSVTIIGTQGPINAATVEIRFNVPGDTLTCWCSVVPDPGGVPTTHSFFANTNAGGVATFNLRGGGCIERGLTAIPGSNEFAGEVFAQGVKMAEFGTVSPDAVDGAGRLPTQTPGLWDPAGTCATALADAVQHTTPLATSTYEWCTDINCDDVVGLTDATILTPFLAGSAACAGNAGATP